LSVHRLFERVAAAGCVTMPVFIFEAARKEIPVEPVYFCPLFRVLEKIAVDESSSPKRQIAGIFERR
jgi:hypothetical protein